MDDARGDAAAEIVLTKISPPPPRSGIVRRPRLTDCLREGAARRLTLISAPTGYGKSVLLSEWHADNRYDDQRSVAWLALDPADSDAVVLSRSLIGALRLAGLPIGPRADSLLRVPGATPAAWMPAVVNELAAAEAPVTLVLEDYHLIESAQAHGVIGYLVDHAPASFRLIVSTRADPPFPLATMRATRQLTELRADDLRFSAAEASALLVGTEGLDLDDAGVGRLTERTEGWAAGLYLAALWLRGSDDAAAAAERFAGEHRHVVDYLTEVVLDGLDEDLRDFLLSTSVVERMTLPLAAALTDDRALTRLARIESSNLFLVPLDHSRTWFRYHHLFRDMLRSELARRHPERLPALHRTTSTWYGAQGMVAEAVDHALAAGDAADADRAAALVGEHWLALLRRGEAATVRGWLARFDGRALERHPELGIVGGIVVGIVGGDQAEFRWWFDLAGRAGERPAAGLPAGITSAAAAVDFLRAVFGWTDARAAIAATLRMLRSDPPPGQDLRVPALANLGFLLHLVGDPPGAGQATRDALADNQIATRPFAHLAALATAAQLDLDSGALVAAETAARRALAYADAVGLTDSQFAGPAHLVLGHTLTVAGSHDAAADAFARGLALVRGSILPAREALALIANAAPAQRAGDLVTARRVLDEAEASLAGLTDAGTAPAQLDAARQRVGVAARRRRTPGSLDLTDPELAVLRLLSGPLTQREIADQLSISINTVKSHTASVYRRLEVTSRAEAVRRAAVLHLT